MDKRSGLDFKFDGYEISVHNSQVKGSNTYGQYVFHQADIWNFLEIGNKRFLCSYQTGDRFGYNDYDYPSNELSLYDDSDELILLVHGLGEAFFDRDENSEKVQKQLQKVRTICPEIDSMDKLYELYIALWDNLPSVDDLGMSIEVDDYNEDEKGTLTLKEMETDK